jgi:hypothetical protein
MPRADAAVAAREIRERLELELVSLHGASPLGLKKLLEIRTLGVLDCFEER